MPQESSPKLGKTANSIITDEIAELRRRILYHWGMGVVRDSTGAEIDMDVETCARMRVFAEEIYRIDAEDRAQLEDRMSPEICSGQGCACSGIVIGIDHGHADGTLRIRSRIEPDGSTVITECVEETRR